jgi:hypothetical protein
MGPSVFVMRNVYINAPAVFVHLAQRTLSAHRVNSVQTNMYHLLKTCAQTTVGNCACSVQPVVAPVVPVDGLLLVVDADLI